MPAEGALFYGETSCSYLSRFIYLCICDLIICRLMGIKTLRLPCMDAKKAVLALSGEGRLRLDIAQASLALHSACTALDAGARAP